MSQQESFWPSKAPPSVWIVIHTMLSVGALPHSILSFFTHRVVTEGTTQSTWQECDFSHIRIPCFSSSFTERKGRGFYFTFDSISSWQVITRPWLRNLYTVRITLWIVIMKTTGNIYWVFIWMLTGSIQNIFWTPIPLILSKILCDY